MPDAYWHGDVPLPGCTFRPIPNASDYWCTGRVEGGWLLRCWFFCGVCGQPCRRWDAIACACVHSRCVK